MRKYLFLLIPVLFFYSCGKSKEEIITGKWKLSFSLDNHLKNLKPVERDAVKKMNVGELQSMIDDFQKELNKTRFIFTKKGKYEIIKNKEKTSEGTWKLNKAKDSLRVFSTDKKVYTYFIEQCTENALNLRMKNSKDPVYLTPVKE